jgi:hypothetical protein
MDKNIHVIDSRVYYTESMRDLGGFRYLLGIAFLFFAIFFLWNGIFIMAALVLISGLIAMENCSETIIDKDKMLLTRKVGVFVPFIKIRSKSIKGVESIAIEMFTTLQYRNKRKERTIKTRYRLYFNATGHKFPIRVIIDKATANAFAKEIAQLLVIDFIKNADKQAITD